MSERPVRLCMIGAGRHASSQLYPLFPRLTGAEVVANADLDLAKARDAARRHGVERSYDDWRRMLDEERPDGCIVCVGARGHADLAVDLLGRGVHVLVEKPHAPDLVASRRMLAASRSAGRICMGAYKKRHTPAYLAARAAWSDPAFGPICHVGCYRAMGGSNQSTPSYLWEWGCHVIDLCAWVGGPVAEIQAWRSRDDWRAVCAVLRYAGGAVGTLTLASPGGNWEELTVLGRGGHAVRVKDGWQCTVFDGNVPCGGLLPSFAASGDSATLMGFLGEVEAFATAIRQGTEPDGAIAEITHTIALHEALLRSLDHGRPEPVEATALSGAVA